MSANVSHLEGRMSSLNSGARLDRLPVSRFHWKLFAVIAVGMFFEGFDIYIAASVLGATYSTGFSTLAQNGLFISTTFVGMTLGALLAGFLGDRYGRRRTYQINLLVFGAAAIGSVFAPNMETLIALRFVMGLGLGAEAVVGYAIVTEFFPRRTRGRWAGMICTTVTTGLPVSAVLAWLLVPTFGWRVMFFLGGRMVAQKTASRVAALAGNGRTRGRGRGAALFDRAQSGAGDRPAACG